MIIHRIDWFVAKEYPLYWTIIFVNRGVQKTGLIPALLRLFFHHGVTHFQAFFELGKLIQVCMGEKQGRHIIVHV